MRPRILFVLLINMIMLTVSLVADETTWPCFHGARRDNIAVDTGLMQAWPQAGPELLWTVDEIGHGYSSVSIAYGRIYTAGMIDRQTYVTAMDLTGKKIWQRLNGQSWEASQRQTWAVSYAGSRGTPTIDGDSVYHLSELGRLTSFDVQTGREHWHVDIMKTFEAERPEYGYSESVLICEDALICCPAGDKGYIVALDKGTGGTLWANTEIKDAVGNCSAVFATIDDVDPQLRVSGGPYSFFVLLENRAAHAKFGRVCGILSHPGLLHRVH